MKRIEEYEEMMRVSRMFWPSLSLVVLGWTVVFSQVGADKRPAVPPPKATKTTKPAAKKPTRATGTAPARGSTPAFRPQSPRIELVRIPAGSFMMGSTNGDADEKPAHQVTLNYSFYMGKYEVTQAQWQAVMGNNPSYFKDCGGNCPVEQVSWDDAQEFIRKLNQMNDGYTYRLPTEAEWEYACRGTTGDYAGTLENMAWYADNSGKRTHPAGQKQANAFGLHDMQGNVWEWCRDWYDANYYASSPATDPQGPGSGQYLVVRGGSWNDDASFLRSAHRYQVTPDLRYVIRAGFGFRVVASARTQ